MKSAVCLGPTLKGYSTATPARNPDTARLGFPGMCPEHPVLTNFLLDDSGSVIGPAGNDPLSNRYAEVRRAIRAVRRWCACSNERAAIVHFDTPTSGCVPPTRLRALSGARLNRSLTVPPDAAGTSVLMPALTVVADYAAATPAAGLVTVVLTDWELFDNEADLVPALNALPGRLIGVGLGRNQRPDVLPPGADFVPITESSSPGSVAQVVFQALKIHRSPLIERSDR